MRKMWNEMRMNPTDFADVSGYTYTYLMNGAAPAGNWTGIFKPGEKIRLRFINGSAQTIFDVRIPGLKMTVISADGQDIEPVSVDERSEEHTSELQSLMRISYAVFCLKKKKEKKQYKLHILTTKYDKYMMNKYINILTHT